MPVKHILKTYNYRFANVLDLHVSRFGTYYVQNFSLILNLILVFAKVAYFDEFLMIYFFIFWILSVFGHVVGHTL